MVVVASLVLAVAAKNLDFALEYRGQCSYSNNNGFCRLKAQSQEILTKIKYVHSIFFLLFFLHRRTTTLRAYTLQIVMLRRDLSRFITHTS